LRALRGRVLLVHEVDQTHRTRAHGASGGRGRNERCLDIQSPHIHEVTVNADIVKYLDQIDATWRPFGGRFAIHGGGVEVPSTATTSPCELFVRSCTMDWYAAERYRARARDRGTRSSPRAPATRLRVATRKGQVLIGSGQSEQWRQPLSGEAARDRGTVGGLTQFLSSTARNPLIPEGRDFRVVEGARLEIESGRAQ